MFTNACFVGILLVLAFLLGFSVAMILLATDAHKQAKEAHKYALETQQEVNKGLPGHSNPPPPPPERGY